MRKLIRAVCAVVCAVSSWVLVSGASQAPAPSTGRARLHVAIQASGEKGPSFAITNPTGKSVTACVFEVSYPPPRPRNSRIAWDELIQSGPVIEPGTTILRPFFLFPGGPVPDKVEIIAGIWDDGRTFGEPELTNNIVKKRVAIAADYEQGAETLQKGLDQKWTRERYQQEFSGKPDSGVVYTVRTALSATAQTAPKPEEFNRVMQTLVQSFRQNADHFRRGKPFPKPPAPK